jgi:hypothetical protein
MVTWNEIATTNLNTEFFKYFFLLACPIRLAAYIFYLFSNKQELGTEIDPGIVITPFPSSLLGQDLNPQPYL